MNRDSAFFGHRAFIEPRPVISTRENRSLVKRVLAIRQNGYLDSIRVAA